jgi:hypothetical protein
MSSLQTPLDCIGNIIPLQSIRSEADTTSRDARDHFHRIAVCAYYKAQALGFEPGHELENWLAAEAELAQSQRDHQMKLTDAGSSSA